MTIKAFINAVKYEKWCQVLTVLMRLVVGGVFIFSGFTKAIDPWGTSYKITDYLTAMGLEEWAATALFIAVALAALEFILGIQLVPECLRRHFVAPEGFGVNRPLQAKHPAAAVVTNPVPEFLHSSYLRF